ncbi:MAG: hypothetical protein LH660_12575 [Phormidesmis sp. CAN_BIN36]|nr:hypothetical protein [Phormidesmis sp. CAN_BIN36]
MAIEEEYEDVPQNIESGIIQIYKENPDLIDAEVATALEALVRIYGAEAQGKSVSTRPIRGVSKKVMESVQQMCEWRLGRVIDIPKGIAQASSTVEVDAIVACLKRIQSSIKLWTQKGGRQGYLTFVSQFIE